MRVTDDPSLSELCCECHMVQRGVYMDMDGGEGEGKRMAHLLVTGVSHHVSRIVKDWNNVTGNDATETQ